MNWEAIGAAGEVVGAIAVFATLLFLALQIRHSNRVSEENTRLLSVEMSRRSNDTIAQWSDLLIQSPDVSRIWEDGLSGQQLPIEEMQRFRLLARNYFGIHAQSYHEYDAVDDIHSRDQMVEFVATQIAASDALATVWEGLRSTPFNHYKTFVNGVDDNSWVWHFSP